jgi:hypothetical protein
VIRSSFIRSLLSYPKEGAIPRDAEEAIFHGARQRDELAPHQVSVKVMVSPSTARC